MVMKYSTVLCSPQMWKSSDTHCHSTSLLIPRQYNVYRNPLKPSIRTGLSSCSTGKDITSTAPSRCTVLMQSCHLLQLYALRQFLPLSLESFYSSNNVWAETCECSAEAAFVFWRAFTYKNIWPETCECWPR